MSRALYDNYVEFKNWSDGPKQGETASFANILDSVGRSGTLDLLEVGFGDGSFMDWARDSGHKIAGLEIIPELVEGARDRGHEAYLITQDMTMDRGFDAIIAIDVLEHLDVSQFGDFFTLSEKVLKNNGVVVGRFPNGDSPFFGRYQYGDYTHDKPLSWRALHQIAIQHGFQVAKAVNPRPRPSRFASRIKQQLAYLVRDAIETILGFAYFGYRTPMDPNIIVIMCRRPSAEFTAQVSPGRARADPSVG